jgi:hypothetical protein
LREIEKWDLIELGFHAQTDGNPFLDVEIIAEFQHKHRRVSVEGFYDGQDVYIVRFMPDMEGTWSYVTHSNLDRLNGQQGSFSCTPPTRNNHGPVRVIDHYHFAYEDGTPYHPVGTTCYVWNHQGDELEEQTLTTLRGSPFNKIRMCVFPKRYVFNNNEPPCYPFEGEVKYAWDPSLLDDCKTKAPPDFWDFTRFNPGYFRRLEKHILDLRELGIEADLIIFHPYDFGAWGFDRMPAEVNDRYLKYLVARISAFRNLWWSFANEYDLMLDRTDADWDHYFKLVQDLDPYDHLRSNHNCRGFYDHGKPWVTHCSVQTSELLQVPVWLNQYKKPVVIDECGYEGDIPRAWGSLSPEALVEYFWLGFATGGYVGHGETYWNEEEILWWAKGGKLQGDSPSRIAFLRQIIEDTPAPGIAPFESVQESREVIPQGVYKGMAAGHNGDDYFLIYLARHQPRFRDFKLPEGSFRIDIIDTWNMTIDRFADNVSGDIRVELPRRKYLAVRLKRTDRSRPRSSD